jgi:hypothetical protein
VIFVRVCVHDRLFAIDYVCVFVGWFDCVFICLRDFVNVRGCAC